ncbi:MAG: ethylbenzene dehydrogenase-related protein [Candidatus Zixiibacteriota bacterium]
MKRALVCVTAVALLVGVFGCSDNELTVAPTPAGLNSEALTTAPVVDGQVDAVWAGVTAYNVTVGQDANYQNAYGQTTVTMKAATVNNTLYILAEWTDPSATESINKKRWQNTAGVWSVGLEDEDRFFIMFDAGDNGVEGADCATMCHQPTAGLMATSGGGHVDVWHWKAARTNPAGFLDDKWWDGVGRGSDAKVTSGYTDNLDLIAGNTPQFMHSTGTAYTGDFLFEADKVAFDGNLNWTGLSIPYYVIDPAATGSRWEVAAKGVYAAGKWTLEMSRSFNTGNPDDVVLGTGSVQVTVAITDNSGSQHSGSSPFNLNF